MYFHGQVTHTDVPDGEKRYVMRMGVTIVIKTYNRY